MDVYFTTVVRMAPHTEGGEIVRLDWDTKKVLARDPMVPTDPWVDDPNPRGNARGGRGIVQVGRRLFAALYHSVRVFDRELNDLGRISNNLFVGLHEMSLSGDALWVASTAIDAAIKVDLEGSLIGDWWARENRNLQERFELEPMRIDKNADNRLLWLEQKVTRHPSHTHLNAVTPHNGDLYVLLNRFGAVYDITADRLVLADERLAGCHNLAFVGEAMLINDSRGSGLMVYDRRGSLERRIDLLEFPEIKALRDKVRDANLQKRPVFVRGLGAVNDRRVLLGISAATVVEIDLYTGELVDLFQYSPDVAVCVHGLAIWNDS